MRSNVLLLVATTIACSGGTSAKPPPKGPAAAVVDAAPPPAAARAAPAGPTLTSFPAVDVSGLPPDKQAAFAQIVNDEICPCDCPKSFAACLQEGTQCRPAVLLAQWLVKQLDADLPQDVLAEALAKEIAGGFAAKPKTPNVAGYSTKGARAAKWTLVEYADFECAHCRVASSALDELVKRRSDVQVVFKHFPLSFHPMARQAAIAAEAASRQGKFWEMHDAIFATQELLDEKLLLGHAKAIGLDVPRFQKDLADPAVAQKVDDSRNEGASFGVEATPMFLVNGRPYFLTRNVEGFELRFAMEEARATSSCR